MALLLDTWQNVAIQAREGTPMISRARLIFSILVKLASVRAYTL